MDFREQFGKLDAKARAAVVFRYREDLPPAHVAQLVDETPEQLERLLGRALAHLRECGALPRSSWEDELCTWLDKLRDDPAFSSFSLVLAVRSRPRPGWFPRRAG